MHTYIHTYIPYTHTYIVAAVPRLWHFDVYMYTQTHTHTYIYTHTNHSIPRRTDGADRTGPTGTTPTGQQRPTPG